MELIVVNGADGRSRTYRVPTHSAVRRAGDTLLWTVLAAVATACAGASFLLA